MSLPQKTHLGDEFSAADLIGAIKGHAAFPLQGRIDKLLLV